MAGKKNIAKLTRKTITDKKGKRTTVWVKTEAKKKKGKKAAKKNVDVNKISASKMKEYGIKKESLQQIGTNLPRGAVYLDEQDSRGVSVGDIVDSYHGIVVVIYRDEDKNLIGTKFHNQTMMS